MEGLNILKRILLVILFLFCAAYFVFFIKEYKKEPLIIRRFLGPNAAREDIERIRKELGYNKPIFISFLKRVKRLFVGDFGITYRTK